MAQMNGRGVAHASSIHSLVGLLGLNDVQRAPIALLYDPSRQFSNCS